MMQVNAMLCDFAEVHGGKLFITGATVNLFSTPTVEPPHPIGAFLAALVTVPWQATNQMHRLRVVVEDSDGQRVALAEPPPGMPISEDDRGAILADFNVGRGPLMQSGEDSLVPIALPIPVPMPHLGPFAVVLSIDGTEMVRLKFRLASPQPMTGYGPQSFGPASLPPMQ